MAGSARSGALPMEIYCAAKLCPTVSGKAIASGGPIGPADSLYTTCKHPREPGPVASDGSRFH